MKAFRVAGLSGLYCLAAILPASATTYYASPSGGGNGTSSTNTVTLQQAATAAHAGDTVILTNGTYASFVTIPNNGTQTQPIIFQAQAKGQAVVYSLNPAYGANNVRTGLYVTILGVNFAPPLSTVSTNGVLSENPNTGWDFEDCIFQNNTSVTLRGDQTPGMGNVTVHHCLFQDCYANSYGGYGLSPTNMIHDVLIQDCLVRRSNLSNVTATGWDGGVNKFLWSNKITVDGLIAYDNNGAPIWFDTDNQNFFVQDCTLFGNHGGDWIGTPTGQPHGEYGSTPTQPLSVLDSEANPGAGTIRNNTIYSNQTGEGIADFQSGSGYSVTGGHLISITGNVLADNHVHVHYSDFKPTGTDPAQGFRALGPADVSGNTFYNWNVNTQPSGAVAMEGTSMPKGLPPVYQIKQHDNFYDSTIKTGEQWGYWDYGSGLSVFTLAQLQSNMQLEDTTSKQQSLSAFAGLLPVGAISDVPTLKQEQDAQAAGQAHAASKSELVVPGNPGIDSQISGLPTNQAINAFATITVFGHTPLIASGTDYTCEVYDHQGRWVSLTVQGSSASDFQSLVLPYATFTAVNLPVNITLKSPYSVKATYPGVLTPHSIGVVGVAGTATNTSTGVYTVQGSGADIFGNADALEYDSTSLLGDGTIIARVTAVSNTNAWAKAGVMIRADASTPGGQQASILVTPTSGNGTITEYRATAGGTTGDVYKTGTQPPYWVKLNRAGNVFTASTSTDGVTWNTLGSPQTIVMSNPVQVGLAVCSHNNSALCTATFDNVQVTTP